MNFKEKLNRYNPAISEEKVVEALIGCYVENTYNTVALKQTLMPILNDIGFVLGLAQ